MLKGPRVELRAVNREDLPRLYQINNDVEIRLLGGGSPPMPRPLAYLQNKFDEESAKKGDETWFGIWADGKLIGDCGLDHFDPTSHFCELGIGIGERDYWGKGYGRETIGLLLDYAFRLRNVRKVWLYTSGTNERAQRCYRACGFVEEGRLRQQDWNGGQYVDRVYMGIMREEWERVGQVQ